MRILRHAALAAVAANGVVIRCDGIRQPNCEQGRHLWRGGALPALEPRDFRGITRQNAPTLARASAA